jgi:predicted enzyme related to lactoylglutathione lyase
MAAKRKKRETFDVGGLAYNRPFRIRRLGHFGFNVGDLPAALKFYCDLLGFSISDPLDFGRRVKDPEERKALGDTVGYFTRHGTDHHSFVIFPKRILNKFAGRRDDSDMTINQITWQVGSLREVVDATT